MVERVYLHIGAPKSGTTFLQQVLWANTDRLLASGLLAPGGGRQAHFRAAKDLRERYADPQRPGTEQRRRGAWDRLVADVHGSDAPVAVISDERLVASSQEQARRAVASLAPAEVHVVCTERALDLLIPSVWQQRVRAGSTASFEAFLAELRHGDAVPGGDVRAFWGMHDPAVNLRRWELPPQRLHLVTVPRPGAAGPELLWQRFATVLGIDPSGVELGGVRSNPSLPRPATEVLRRLNQTALGSLPAPERARLVKQVLLPVLAASAADTGRTVLPPEFASWVAGRAEQIVTAVADLGCDVVGDLEDLRPRADDGPLSSTTPETEEVLDVAVAALAAVLQQPPVSGRH